LVLFLRACQMVGIRVAGERELLGIAQGANVCTRRDGIVCPLAAGVLRVADSDVGDGLVGLVAPLDTRRGIDLGVGIGSDEGIEQCVDGQCLGRVAQRRQKVGVEVAGQVQQVGLAAELGVEEGVMVAADIVGDVSMQDVRQDERRGAVAYGGLAIGVAGRAKAARTNNHRVNALRERASHGLLQAAEAMGKSAGDSGASWRRTCTCTKRYDDGIYNSSALAVSVLGLLGGGTGRNWLRQVGSRVRLPFSRHRMRGSDPHESTRASPARSASASAAPWGSTTHVVERGHTLLRNQSATPTRDACLR
jgi:hypothetical protein